MRVSINGRVGVTFIKPPENAMKLRESRLSHHLKPTQITPHMGGGGWGGCFLLESNFTFIFAPLLARIKFYLHICTPTVSKTVPSC